MKRAPAIVIALGVTAFAVAGAGARTSAGPPPRIVFGESQSLWGQAFTAGVRGARQIYVRATSSDPSPVGISLSGKCGRVGSRRVTQMKKVFLNSTSPNQVWKMTPVPAHAVCYVGGSVFPPFPSGGTAAGHLVDITMMATGIAGPKTTPRAPTRTLPPGQVYASGYGTVDNGPIAGGTWYEELSTVLDNPTAVYAQIVTRNPWLNVMATIDCEGAAPSRLVRHHVRPGIIKLPMPTNVPPDGLETCDTNVSAASTQRHPIWLRLSNAPA
jgi:hypothetical protein